MASLSLLARLAMLASLVRTVSPILCPDDVALARGFMCCSPFLFRHYPVSLVLWEHPTAQRLLSFLLLQLVRHTLSYKRPFWALPGFPYSLDAQLDRSFDPGWVYQSSPFRVDKYCLPQTTSVSATIGLLSFRACLVYCWDTTQSILPRWLSVYA